MNTITTLSFVKKSHEIDDIYTFYFSANRQFKHEAGQHGIFILPSLHRPHPFTLSSAPGEEFVAFTTHTQTGSPFKQKLMQLSPGSRMFMFGPVMNFTYDKHATKHVFLARGIGITPFRSMLVHAHTTQLPATTTLIHVDNKPHAFMATTKRLATRARYPSKSEEFQKLIKAQEKDQVFYLSGSPRFVSATKKLLKKQGVEGRNIRTDSFLGY